MNWCFMMMYLQQTWEGVGDRETNCADRDCDEDIGALPFHFACRGIVDRVLDGGW